MQFDDIKHFETYICFQILCLIAVTQLNTVAPQFFATSALILMIDFTQSRYKYYFQK